MTLPGKEDQKLPYFLVEYNIRQQVPCKEFRIDSGENAHDIVRVFRVKYPVLRDGKLPEIFCFRRKMNKTDPGIPDRAVVLQDTRRVENAGAGFRCFDGFFGDAEAIGI